jgi:hypothetical protein
VGQRRADLQTEVVIERLHQVACRTIMKWKDGKSNRQPFEYTVTGFKQRRSLIPFAEPLLSVQEDRNILAFRHPDDYFIMEVDLVVVME